MDNIETTVNGGDEMKKQLLATALMVGALGGAWTAPSGQPNARADVDLVVRCIGPLLLAQTRPVAVPPECDMLFWTNLRPVRGGERLGLFPPGRRGAAHFPRVPRLASPPAPVPFPDWIYTLGHIA